LLPPAPEGEEPLQEATLDGMQALHAGLGIERAVLVQPALLGADATVMLQALARHRNVLRGVAIVGPDTQDETLERLAHTGIRGLKPAGRRATDPDALEALALRAEPLGLHLELPLRAADLPRLAPVLADLAVDVVVEHFGRPAPAEGVRAAGFQALLRLVRAGKCWVKFSGADRISAEAEPYADLAPFIAALTEADPTRLVWGSDWPHATLRGRPPNTGLLLDLLLAWAPDDRLRHLILVENPARLYGFGE
jgi:predicted TIM-barrel fold metal-dependent hydrolase